MPKIVEIHSVLLAVRREQILQKTLPGGVWRSTPLYSFPEPVEYFPPEKEDPAATVTGAAAAPEPESSRRCPEAPCHHHAQGVSVNPFGYPPLSDQ